MTMQDPLLGALLDDACLSLDELARSCAVRHDWVIARVQDGLLATRGELPSDWRFSSRDLARARQMLRLERDFDAVPELAALFADLLEELEAMRLRLRRAGID